MSEIEIIRIDHFQKKVDDPLASTVSWHPANPGGGASVKWQHMYAMGDKIIVGRSVQAILFASFFIIPGCFALFIGAPSALLKGDIVSGFFGALWGGIFAGGGWFFAKHKRFIFDKSAGIYFLGKAFNYSASKNSTMHWKLSNIHAIQLLTKRIVRTAGNSNYTSYELNLILKNAQRINVMDGGDKYDIENSAIRLASYLNVPVWKPVSREMSFRFQPGSGDS